MAETERPTKSPDEMFTDDLIESINSAFDDGSESIPLAVAFEAIERRYLVDMQKLKSD